MSLTVMSVLAVGISSAMLVSVRSIEQTTSKSTCIRQASGLSQEMARELSTAVSVRERGTNAVTLSVPDRDADGSSEDIRYSWSGTAAAPLYRQYNTQTAVAVVDNVYQFRLGYDFVSLLLQNLPGGEFLFAEHTSASDLNSVRPGNTNWFSQSFVPKLPDGAVSWKITGLAFCCKQRGDSAGQLTIQLCYAQADGKPSTAFCQLVVPESSMSTSYAWQNLPVSCTVSLSPGAWVCMVLRGNATDTCELRDHTKSTASEGCYLYQSTNSGLTWALQASTTILFQAYGDVLGASAGTTPETRLASVRWQLQVGNDLSNTIHGGAQTANLPE